MQRDEQSRCGSCDDGGTNLAALDGIAVKIAG
jgi:hypothetical protein